MDSLAVLFCGGVSQTCWLPGVASEESPEFCHHCDPAIADKAQSLQDRSQIARGYGEDVRNPEDVWKLAAKWHDDARSIVASQLAEHYARTPEVIERFIRAAQDPIENYHVRLEAVVGLGQVVDLRTGPLTQAETSIIRALCVALKDDLGNAPGFFSGAAPTPLSVRAANVIRKFGQRGLIARESLLETIEGTREDQVRIYAAVALFSVDPENAELALRVLIAAAHSNDLATQLRSISALESLGPSAQSAIPALKEIAVTNPKLTTEISRALKSIQPEQN